MKVTFRVHHKSGKRLFSQAIFKSSASAWRHAEETYKQSRDTLKRMGFKVSRHVDVSDSEEAIAVEIAEEIIGPKKVGLLRGLGKLLGL